MMMDLGDREFQKQRREEKREEGLTFKETHRSKKNKVPPAYEPKPKPKVHKKQGSDTRST
jgi:hypothetical protein